MSNLRKAIRHKRFHVKNGKLLELIVVTNFGNQFKFQVFDCSNTGLKTKLIEKITIPPEDLREGEIVSSAKLAWEGTEVSLGRLLIRRAVLEGDTFEAAFSIIDIPVPVNSSLSKILEIDLDENDSEKELSSNAFTLAHFVENEYTNVDLFERIREFSIFHREWVRSDKYAYQNVRYMSKGNRISLTRLRKSGRNDYIVMGSNDYLGLGAHPEVVKAAREATEVYGFGSTGSPVTTGLSDLHVELCAKLAKLHKKDAAVLFNSGYAANVGIITSLTSSNDLVIADQLCHASIQDALQMSRATSRYFKHNDVAHLKSILSKERHNYNGCLIITEGVFSMDGDTAELDQIYSIAREYNARIMVDQAHCFGVVGPNALGICDKHNLLRETDVIMGTFSKICGGIGGFVTGSQDLIDWIRHFSRAYIFSVALPPSNIAAASKALDIFTADKSLVENLKKNIKHFARSLKAIGYNGISLEHESAVIPVVIGDEAKMGAMYQSLLEDGILCTPVVYPAVSRKNCRFRFTIMATHSVSDLDYAITCLEKAMLRVGFKFSDKETKEKKTG
jgi:8-amino-7-oxononanoate synthase